ncbi:NADH-quinone oxidoreductase subunit NuoF [Symbiobacterium thermophilum]|uniref:NADH-quinone oxidoreductase subunit F n=1 Tax=Symbiobacterium thermophilum TaxID=2734 RepID=A0A953IAU7_SYMTR|nr:NADH-quinone oxidoreductase subunit NuoF [Symbiobacterium thermophilum]MBY6277289.1 NADH-quinone oxidoreductase subunit F [Symbiobacterium thermophilum]
MIQFEPVLTKGIGKVDLTNIDVYEAQGGYQALRKALAMEPQAIVEEVKKANLRGRGGAGFPAGVKWGFLPNDGRPRYLTVNADESEPGTCNNRTLIYANPHQLIEGILITAYANRITQSFIYIRGEFKRGAEILMKAIEDARRKGYVGQNILGTGFSQEITVHRGASAYICGEESALLNSLEGRRGEPRVKPPFPAVVGLYGCPTIINNVETISNVPHIIKNGWEWYTKITANPDNPKSCGPKIFTVSGCVQRPGNYELPMGVKLRDVIEIAGGLRPGRKLKAVQPGGSSTPMLTPDHLDVPMDFESVAAAGSLLGTAAVIVYDDTVDLVDVALYWARFYSHESCGQCTPCREGTHWLERVFTRIKEGGGTEGDLKMIADMQTQMAGTTICVLSDAAVAFPASLLKLFPEELDRYINRVKEVRPA